MKHWRKNQKKEEMSADLVEADNEFIDEGKLVMGSRPV